MASILVSEVEPGVRRLFAFLVERLGHEAIVLDGDAVFPPRADLLIVDPTARASARHLSLVRERFPELPVISFNSLPDSFVITGTGPLHFLPKPFAPEQLEAALERALSPL